MKKTMLHDACGDVLCNTYLGMLSSFYADTRPDSNRYYRYIDYNSD